MDPRDYFGACAVVRSPKREKGLTPRNVQASLGLVVAWMCWEDEAVSAETPDFLLGRWEILGEELFRRGTEGVCLGFSTGNS